MSKKITIKMIIHTLIFFSIAAILIFAKLSSTNYSLEDNQQNIMKANLLSTGPKVYGPHPKYISTFSEIDEQEQDQITREANPPSSKDTSNYNNSQSYPNINNTSSSNGSQNNSSGSNSNENSYPEVSNPFEKQLSVKSGNKTIVGSPSEILSKVVAAEISSSFHPEAIKAQAIAAHSFIRYNNDKGVAPTVHIRDASSNIENITKSVSNKLIYYGNSIANTVYHATAAGRTNSSADVWGGHIPYLISVDSKYDNGNIFSGAKNWGEKVIINKNKVKSLVKQNTSISLIPNDELNWFRLASPGDNQYTSGGYINKIYLGGQPYTGRNIREKALVDGSKWLLKSAKFDIDYNGNDFMFTTYGYGHGVGLSQDGANGYAKNEGYNYEKILKHYYPGVAIK